MGWPELFSWLRGEFERIRMEPMMGGLTSVRTLGDPLEELRRLRESAALIPIPHWFLMDVTGADAADYLHRRLTQPIKKLESGRGVHALQLAGDGRLQCDLLVYRSGEKFHALAHRANLPSAFALAEKYVLMDRVEVERTWESEGTLAMAGPKAAGILARLAGAPQLEAEGFAMADGADLFGMRCRIFRDGRWPAPFFHVAAPLERLEDLARELAGACAREGGGMAAHEALDCFRIECGVPAFGPEMDEATIPLEADLWDAIDFEKGCFPGQEVMARIRNLGHPARQLARLRIAGEREIAPKTPVYDGEEEIGAVTSARTIAGAGETLAMGYLKWDRRAATRGVVGAGRDRAEAEIAALDRHCRAAYGDGSKPTAKREP